MFNLLRNKGFMAYWIAQFISQIANSFHLIALPLWVLSITKSPFHTGAIAIVETISILIFSLFAGVIVDRVNRKFLLIISDLIRFGLILSLLLVKSEDNFWFVYLIAIGMGIMSSFFIPAQTAAIQTIFKKEELSAANSLLMLSMSVSLIIGPILGGTALEYWGYSATFIINSLSFFIGAIGSLIIKVPNLNSDSKNITKKNVFFEIIEGIKVIRETIEIKKVLLFQLFTFLGTGANSTLFILHLKGAGASPNLIGTYMSTQGIGMIVGSLFLPNIIKKFKDSSLLMHISLFLISITLILFIQSSPYFIIISIISIFIFGLFLSFLNVLCRTLLQQSTPEQSMGRVASVSRIVITGASATSTALGSLLVYLLSAKTIVSIGGGILLVFSLFSYVHLRASKRLSKETQQLGTVMEGQNE
ncbi:MFS transporter [Anoxybacillus flavithermus]|uniref:Major facilitator superfamily permease n=2 Tax=Anoxybacillus flavithermus TaxID=33934 RepID=R4G1K3_9BACL|nr:MFS transporter [Anoxybacillus flavithermus]ACJ34802.1 Permease of the major facilitator superfamily [Anoxybacillus flavithermus WK1]AST06266.1 MFS transporter [Anoxybacillus flavithermus]GAC91614.1 major facilitator superfamily permease [Anoxybacillus flavithermus NBRC 109594]